MSNPKPIIFSENTKTAADTHISTATAANATAASAATAASSVNTNPNPVSKPVSESGEILKAIIESAANYCPNVTLSNITTATSEEEIKKKQKDGMILFKLLTTNEKTTYIYTHNSYAQVLQNDFQFAKRGQEIHYIEVTSNQTLILRRKRNIMTDAIETVVCANSILQQNNDGSLKIGVRPIMTDEWIASNASIEADDPNGCKIM